jgi:hypothetical protein
MPSSRGTRQPVPPLRPSLDLLAARHHGSPLRAAAVEANRLGRDLRPSLRHGGPRNRSVRVGSVGQLETGVGSVKDKSPATDTMTGKEE